MSNGTSKYCIHSVQSIIEVISNEKLSPNASSNVSSTMQIPTCQNWGSQSQIPFEIISVKMFTIPIFAITRLCTSPLTINILREYAELSQTEVGTRLQSVQQLYKWRPRFQRYPWHKGQNHSSVYRFPSLYRSPYV